MTWANPWAWLGLVAVAVPILIHLLARQTTKALPFPTLRFLPVSAIVEVRRRRLSDLPLMAIRVAVIGLAVAALAQPFVASRQSAAVNRLVLIDASASVDLDGARAAARKQQAGTTTFTAIERANLSLGLRDAARWAASQSGSTTVVVVSDFQLGALDPPALRLLPSATGVVLERVANRTQAVSARGARMSTDGWRTTASWDVSAESGDAIEIASAHDVALARAMISAGRRTAAAHAGTPRPATFVLRNAPNRAALLASSTPPNEPWMFDVIAAIAPGRVEAIRAAGDRALVFLATDDPAIAADAIREALPALVAGPAIGELEPATMTDAERRALEREAAPAAPDAAPRAWAGRWLWIAALMLLAVESLMRRSRRVTEGEVARAA